MESGSLIQFQIHDIAFGGKGVGRAGGLAVFVPFVIAGERVTARVARKKKKFAEAELISVDEPSPDRVEPRCPYFGVCGGCAYQHIRYERQLEIKAAQVEQTLRRLGHLAGVPMQPAIASTRQYGYRNRIRVHAEGAAVGFYRHDRHELIDIEQCPIATPEVNERLASLRQSLTRDGDYVLSGERREYFVQTNDEVAAALLDLVGRLIAPGSKTLVDAYSGAGFFSRRLASRFNQVIGIEENERAVEYARRMAGPNESYVAGDVAIRLGDVLASYPAAETCLILDPPAAGAAPRAIELILGAMPAELIYVSCDPATLARDLETLCRTYKLRSVTPLDMFPQTAEIEVVAHLTLGG
ncbi:MAG: TRAM domain-containing protein [Chthoniobacteraceae bacterium]|jgi:23S rRNA (uracil1939-C5)-methyltransferase